MIIQEILKELCIAKEDIVETYGNMSSYIENYTIKKSYPTVTPNIHDELSKYYNSYKSVNEVVQYISIYEVRYKKLIVIIGINKLLR
ncbi:MAG: hypothetical protein ACM3O3_12945 [Syntrophothermus sp.]